MQKVLEDVLPVRKREYVDLYLQPHIRCHVMVFKNQRYFIIVIIGSIISVSSISAVTLCNFKIKYLYLLYPPYYAIILFDLLLGSLKVGIN